MKPPVSCFLKSSLVLRCFLFTKGDLELSLIPEAIYFNFCSEAVAPIPDAILFPEAAVQIPAFKQFFPDPKLSQLEDSPIPMLISVFPPMLKKKLLLEKRKRLPSCQKTKSKFYPKILKRKVEVYKQMKLFPSTTLRIQVIWDRKTQNQPFPRHENFICSKWFQFQFSKSLTILLFLSIFMKFRQIQYMKTMNYQFPIKTIRI
jgi:hypothetical protein